MGTRVDLDSLLSFSQALGQAYSAHWSNPYPNPNPNPNPKQESTSICLVPKDT